MSALWLLLWIGLVAVGLGVLAWLVDRIGGPDHWRARRSQQHYLDEVEARVHSPYL